MYIPDHFNVPDINTAIAFIRANAFGQLVSQVDGQLFASHIPFLISGDGDRMFCHIARKNPQWQGIETQDVLVTFQGPHDYISPSWYSAPGVPTWNYQAAHVYAGCRAIHAPDELREIVEKLTRTYEAKFEKPWQPRYSETMLKNIVGLVFNVRDIQCKFKLNQNRSETDRTNVVAALDALGSAALAGVMRDNVL